MTTDERIARLERLVMLQAAVIEELSDKVAGLENRQDQALYREVEAQDLRLRVASR